MGISLTKSTFLNYFITHGLWEILISPKYKNSTQCNILVCLHEIQLAKIEEKLMFSNLTQYKNLFVDYLSLIRYNILWIFPTLQWISSPKVSLHLSPTTYLSGGAKLIFQLMVLRKLKCAISTQMNHSKPSKIASKIIWFVSMTQAKASPMKSSRKTMLLTHCRSQQCVLD